VVPGGRKLIGRNSANLIVGWSGRFLIFVVPRQFSQEIGEWPENQILIPDWTYFHCPGTTLVKYDGKNWCAAAPARERERESVTVHMPSAVFFFSAMALK